MGLLPALVAETGTIWGHQLVVMLVSRYLSILTWCFKYCMFQMDGSIQVETCPTSSYITYEDSELPTPIVVASMYIMLYIVGVLCLRLGVGAFLLGACQVPCNQLILHVTAKVCQHIFQHIWPGNIKLQGIIPARMELLCSGGRET